VGQSIVALRQALADKRAVQLWAEGQAMALDEAIAYALRVNS
jgi:hypothetical protein